MVKSKVFFALISTAMTAAIVGGSTFALFTSNATNSNNTFSSGTLDISLDKEDPNGGAYFNVANMAPGDSEIRPVVVSNEGSLPLEYTLSLSVGGDLGTLDANKLNIAAYLSEADAQSGSNPINLTEPRSLDVEGGTKEKETFFVKVQLPLEASNIYQNKTGSASIIVNAAQKTEEDNLGSLIWQHSGDGITTVTPTADQGISFGYDHSAFNGEWRFSTTAKETKDIILDWTYTGLHSWYQANAKVTLFSEGPDGTVSQQIVDSGVYHVFNFAGRNVIKVNKGYKYGIFISGNNNDSSRILNGNFTMKLDN